MKREGESGLRRRRKESFLGTVGVGEDWDRG
jgi:hypothetical protein